MKGNLVVEDGSKQEPVSRQAVVFVNSAPRLHSRGMEIYLSGTKRIPPRLHELGFLQCGADEAQLHELIQKDTDRRPLENP